MAKNPQPAGALRLEIERRLLNGWCVYCRAPAAPDRPLTREHLIPRSRGGRRKDAGIIVPACAPCNHHRGCRELVLFLLARPQRIASFLDFLDSLPPECLGELDRRVIADLYAAVWLLCESTLGGAAWRERLRRLCSGRRLHRRRYAARRVVGAVTARLDRRRRRTRQPAGPSCLIPAAATPAEPLAVGHSLEVLRAGLVTQLARLAGSPAEWVLLEIARELRNLGRSPGERAPDAPEPLDSSHAFLVTEGRRQEEWGGEEVVSLERWRRRRRKWRRSRSDRRGGRRVRGYAA